MGQERAVQELSRSFSKSYSHTYSQKSVLQATRQLTRNCLLPNIAVKMFRHCRTPCSGKRRISWWPSTVVNVPECLFDPNWMMSLLGSTDQAAESDVSSGRRLLHGQKKIYML